MDIPQIADILAAFTAGLAASWIMPKRYRAPIKVTISCREDNCSWEISKRDFGKDQTSPRLMRKLTDAHKAHYSKMHPGKSWEVGIG